MLFTNRCRHPKNISSEIHGFENENDRVYAAMLECMDDAVGAIVKTAEKHLKRENTLFIFTSDNGAFPEVRLQRETARG